MELELLEEEMFSRVELKSAWTTSGELFAIHPGQTQKPLSSVTSLDSHL